MHWTPQMNTNERSRELWSNRFHFFAAQSPVVLPHTVYRYRHSVVPICLPPKHGSQIHRNFGSALDQPAKSEFMVRVYQASVVHDSNMIFTNRCSRMLRRGLMMKSAVLLLAFCSVAWGADEPLEDALQQDDQCQASEHLGPFWQMHGLFTPQRDFLGAKRLSSCCCNYQSRNMTMTLLVSRNPSCFKMESPT